jgi:uncharacterized membrane protein SpoIIM required for sporulation
MPVFDFTTVKTIFAVICIVFAFAFFWGIYVSVVERKLQRKYKNQLKNIDKTAGNIPSDWRKQ